MTKETAEYFDTDFLGNKINIGDKVIFEAPKYRDFVIGTVVTKAPKSCQIEYINDWNYSKGHKEVVRQYYGQIIKYPLSAATHAKWIIPDDHYPDTCSNCLFEFVWDGEEDYRPKFCPECGAVMDSEDNVLRKEVD